MLNSLLSNFFTNDIAIDVDADRFTFTTNGRFTTLMSFLCLQRGSDGTLKVVTVGETIDGVSGEVMRVDLFAASPLPPEVPDRFELLQAFIRFAFNKLQSRTAIVRPTVVIRGAHKLSSVLNGYERGLLSRAVMSTGARSVTFG